MNRSFALPAAFAFAVHAFVLFGLTGKPPVTALTPVVPPSPGDALPPDRSLEIDPGPGETDGDPGAEIAGDPVPSLVEIPPIGPIGDFFVIAPTPPTRDGGLTRTIPVHWNLPGAKPGWSDADVADLPSLDHVPRPRVQPAPDYPYDLRARGIEATVIVEFLVDESGNVYRAVVLRATAPGFEEPVLRAVEKWKFEPGLKHNRRVRFRMSVPVVFSIRPD